MRHKALLPQESLTYAYDSSVMLKPQAGMWWVFRLVAGVG